MNDVIELEYVSYKDSDDIGDVVKGEAYWNKIYANKKSITQSEFYQAQAQGFKPELKFEINTFEYEDNRRIRYKGRIYKILRIYEISSEKMEIVCIGNINGDS